VIIDSPIPDRICWKCSPEASAKQLKSLMKKKDEEEEVVVGTKEKKNDAYETTTSFLTKWHTDNGMKIPDCFQPTMWNLYFFSRGSMLREWGRCMNYWMKEESCYPVTDMTPGKDLERKIKDRRESSGATGPGFRTVQDKVANLRGDLECAFSKSRYGPNVHTSSRGVIQVTHRAPKIPAPTGEGGTAYIVV
jgi:hypothetical protein